MNLQLAVSTITTATSEQQQAQGAPYWWAYSLGDLELELALMLIFVASIVFFVIYVVREGKYGRFFNHANNAMIGEEFQNTNRYEMYDLEQFGPMLRIRNGSKKNHLVIPRPGSAYKTENGPMILPIIGGGKAMTVIPYVAEYLKRLEGNEATLWLGQKPPEKISDLDSLYTAYCRMKADKEVPNEAKKKKWVDEQMEGAIPPEDLPVDKLPEWTKNARAFFQQEYDESGPTFKASLRQLENPSLPETRKAEIQLFLNGQIRSEPPQLWAASIAGMVVGIDKVADFIKPITGTEMTSFFNTVYAFLAKLRSDTMKYILVFALAFVMIAIGAAIAFSVIH